MSSVVIYTFKFYSPLTKVYSNVTNMMKMESKTERAMMRLLKELAISFVERTEIVNIFPRRPNNPITGCTFRVIYNLFPTFYWIIYH